MVRSDLVDLSTIFFFIIVFVLIRYTPYLHSGNYGKISAGNYEQHIWILTFAGAYYPMFWQWIDFQH